MVNTWLTPNWIVRTHGNFSRLPELLRTALQQVDPLLPFSTFQSLAEIRGASLADQRYQAILFSCLAALALLLAALGIYGLVAQSVVQRRREISIRLALGASARRVMVAAVLPGLAMTAAGIAAGLLLSQFAARLLSSLLWGARANDSLTIGIVAGLLLTVAVVASVIPALRLLRLDPAQTLRGE